MVSSRSKTGAYQNSKRRKARLTTPSTKPIQELLRNFKPSQLREVINEALNSDNGNVTKCIHDIHALSSRKLPIEDYSKPLDAGQVPVDDEVVESIEKSPTKLRQDAPASAPKGLSVTATNGNLPTPRSSQEPKEIPMTPEPWMTPVPQPNAQPSPLPEAEQYNSPPVQLTTCNCRSGCISTRCKCFKSGRGCSPSPSSGCKCDSCANMLNDLSIFFGSPKSPDVPVSASPDFLKWIRKESRNGRFDLIHPDTIEELRSMLMGVEYGDMTSPPQFPAFSGKLRGIGKAWMKSDITDEERKEVKKELFKEAFGVAGPKDTKNDYWCFCKNEWKQTILWEYCTKCHECRDTREWHCGECGNRNIGKGCECQKGAKRRRLHQGATCVVIIPQ
ncbi:hypothetical protein BGAL_0766g00010 [Botrytis galanthina]|uniref:Tesmin/TSO1-like CXC domain-containing protein n=1 Tax=Botrytis galanthina TaxID=278940 RepID=A0A4S8QH50_9HELO|nr:hypothetical protein BGAL_0766g00010 [Botrytis galanthina]